MNLVKWDPFREMEDISTRLNRIFARKSFPHLTARGLLKAADWTPSVDISETDTAYLIKAEIPGVRKEDTKVRIQNGMLTIQGQRNQEKEEKGAKFHRIERTFGSFLRSFRLPDDAADSGVTAEFKDGMLNVTLPKAIKTREKAVSITVN